MKLQLDPKYAELRAIRYASPSRTTLIRLNEGLQAERLPPFVPTTISQIGGFYLQSSLQPEKEVRLLVKRYKGGRNDAQSDGSHEFWPVEIGKPNDICGIELLEIQLGPQADRASAEAAIVGTSFDAVPIV